MRKILLLIPALLLSLATMAQKVQIFELTSSNTKATDKGFVFENDTVKVNYYFWHNKGISSFSVTNKTASTLYLDRESSTFHSLDETFDLWRENDGPIEPAKKIRASYFYPGSLIVPEGVNAATLSATESKGRSTRIVAIPAGGTIALSEYYVFPLTYFKFGPKYETKMVPQSGNKAVTTTVYELDFTEENSPLRIASKLVFGKNEKMEGAFSSMANFHLAKAVEVDNKHFHDNKKAPSKADQVAQSSMKKGTSFYLVAPNGKAVK